MTESGFVIGDGLLESNSRVSELERQEVVISEGYAWN